MLNVTEQLQHEIRSAGMEPPHVMEPGKFYRFPGKGKSNSNKAGWCFPFIDGLGGQYGDFSSGLSVNVQCKRDKPFTVKEQEAFKKNIHDTNVKVEKLRAKARKRAQDLLADSISAPQEHKYLSDKQIKSFGLSFKDSRLIIPIYEGTELQSLQFIDKNGNKRFLKDGKAKGGHFILGNVEGAKNVCIAEGYATAATIHEAVGYPVVMAFTSGNLLPVAKAIQKNFPEACFIICADDDVTISGNPGITKAKEAANEVGGVIALPTFGAQRPDKVSDFNDMARLEGISSVRSVIETAIATVQEQKKADVPDPLPEYFKAPEFPLEALGPILGNAAKQLAYHVQAPKGMAGQSVLAAAALVAQQHINVQRGFIGKGPVSLFCISVAESGDRKSGLDRLALSPIRAFEQIRRNERNAKLSEYRAEMAVWQSNYDAILRKMKKIQNLSSDQEENYKFHFLRLENEKPKLPLRSNITFADATPEGIWKHLLQADPSAGLFTDEGISFFSGHGMNEDMRGRTIGMLCKLWDGDPIDRTRSAENESGILAGRRLSAHLMMQPVIGNKIFGDLLLLGQGFLARFLVSNDESIAGTRFLKDRDLTQGAENDPAIIKYCEVLSSLLKRPASVDIETGELMLKTSQLKGEVFETWCMLHDGIEVNLKKDGRFQNVKAVASKAAENIARIAAVIAYVEGHDHPTVEHVENAGIIMSYYLETMVIRTQTAQQDVDQVAARDLLEWIKQKGGILKATDFKLLPQALRVASTARKHLEALVKMGHLEITSFNTNKVPKEWKVLPC